MFSKEIHSPNITASIQNLFRSAVLSQSPQPIKKDLRVPILSLFTMRGETKTGLDRHGEKCVWDPCVLCLVGKFHVSLDHSHMPTWCLQMMMTSGVRLCSAPWGISPYMEALDEPVKTECLSLLTGTEKVNINSREEEGVSVLTQDETENIKHIRAYSPPNIKMTLIQVNLILMSGSPTVFRYQMLLCPTELCLGIKGQVDSGSMTQTPGDRLNSAGSASSGRGKLYTPFIHPGAGKQQHWHQSIFHGGQRLVQVIQSHRLAVVAAVHGQTKISSGVPWHMLRQLVQFCLGK